MSPKIRFHVQSRFNKLFHRYTCSNRQNSCFVSGNFGAVTGHSWSCAWFYPVPPVNIGTVPHINRRSLLAASFPILHSRFNTSMPYRLNYRQHRSIKHKRTINIGLQWQPSIQRSPIYRHDTLWTEIPYSRVFRYIATNFGLKSPGAIARFESAVLLQNILHPEHKVCYKTHNYTDMCPTVFVTGWRHHPNT